MVFLAIILFYETIAPDNYVINFLYFAGVRPSVDDTISTASTIIWIRCDL